MNTKPIIENRFWQPEFECLPRPQLLALQAERLRTAVARAANNPFYKAQFAQLGPGAAAAAGGHDPGFFRPVHHGPGFRRPLAQNAGTRQRRK